MRLADVPRRILPFALLALVAGACSGDRHAFLEPLKVESAGQMTFRFTPPPRSEGPALGAEHLFFIDGRRGFVATTGGGGYQQHVGYNLPTEPGRIQITNDGGRTWRTVWARRNVVFQSISFADRTTGLAVGSALDLRGYRGAGDPPSHTLLMRTRDGGRTWRALKPRPAFGPHFFLGEYSSPTIPDDHGFQLAGATTWYAFGRETRRSRDGGQTWVKVPMPPGATLLQFPSADVGYAAAKSPRCGGQQLWKTTDGARSWSLLSGTCAASYMSIDFLDERRGFTSAGPREDYLYEKPQLVIRATTDGGLSWETRYVDPSHGVGRDHHWPAPTQLHFLDNRNGWAVSHEISQGFTFDDLHVTRDGGRHWQRRWFPSWQLPSAFAAGGRAWATNHWTTNWGRTWRMSVRPAQISPYRLRVATRTRLVVETGQGVIESHDGGQTWSTRTPLSDRRAAEAMRLPAYIRTRSGAEGDTGVPVSSDGRRLQVPKRFYTGAVAFRTGQRGLLASGDPSDTRVPIFATRDGGQSWLRLKLPAGVSEDAEVRIGPGLAVILSGYSGLLLTTDEGRRWSKVPIKDDYWECGAQKFGEGPYWLLCHVDFTHGRTVLFRSEDGELWRRSSSLIQPDPHLIAVGPDEAWTIDSKALWHTTDGGDSWLQVWPTLRPGDRAYYLGHFRAGACC